MPVPIKPPRRVPKKETEKKTKPEKPKSKTVGWTVW